MFPAGRGDFLDPPGQGFLSGLPPPEEDHDADCRGEKNGYGDEDDQGFSSPIRS